MHFAINYEFAPGLRDEAQARFKAGGGLPPEGVKMLTRWHYAEGHGGFVIAESSDAVAIAKWMQDWTDVLSFDISPVLTDEQVQEVIG